MSAVIFLVTAFFCVPLAVFAQQPPEEYVCADFAEPKEGQKADASTSGTKTMENGQSVQDAIKQTKVETTDTVEVKDGKVIVTSQCGKKGTVGKVCFTGGICVDKKPDGSIDDAAIKGAIQSQAIKEGARDAINQQVNEILKNADKLKSLGWARAGCGFTGSCDDLARYEELIKSLGVDNKDFLNAVQRNPDAVKDLLTNIAAGDTAGAETIARNIGLKLGVTGAQLESLSQNAVRAFPEDVRGAIAQVSSDLCAKTGACGENIVKEITGFTSPAGVASESSTGAANATEKRGFGEVRISPKIVETFRQRFQQAENALQEALTQSSALPEKLKEALRSGGAAAIANLESRLNASARPCRLGRCLSSAKGLFQFLDGTERAVGFSPGATLDPVLSSQAFVRLVEQNYQQAGAEMNTAMNAGLNPTIAAYVAHNLGGAGSKNFLTGYAQNPNIPVNRVVSAAAIRNNPSLYGNGTITIGQATENIAAKLSGTRSSSFTGSGARRYSSGSPFSGSSSGGLGGLIKNFLGGGSSSSSGSGSSGTSGGGGTFGGGGASGSFSGSGSSGGSSGSSVSQPLPPLSAEENNSQEETQEPEFSGPPSLSLVVHPSTAQKGESVSVIWSAVGVSTARVCQLSAESTEGSGVVAEGNEGTKVIQVPVNTPLTELRFSLRCVPQDTRVSPEDAQTAFTLRIN